MPRRAMLSVFALALGTMAAEAADLAIQSRLGAVFAEPPPVVVYRTAEYEAPIIPYNLLPNPPWNLGNYTYGSSLSFSIRPLLRRTLCWTAHACPMSVASTAIADGAAAPAAPAGRTRTHKGAATA